MDQHERDRDQAGGARALCPVGTGDLLRRGERILLRRNHRREHDWPRGSLPGGGVVVRARPRPADGPPDLANGAACVEGADEERVYLDRLERAGFTDVEVLDRQPGQIYSATVRARKPAAL